MFIGSSIVSALCLDIAYRLQGDLRIKWVLACMDTFSYRLTRELGSISSPTDNVPSHKSLRNPAIHLLDSTCAVGDIPAAAWCYTKFLCARAERVHNATDNAISSGMNNSTPVPLRVRVLHIHLYTFLKGAETFLNETARRSLLGWTPSSVHIAPIDEGVTRCSKRCHCGLDRKIQNNYKATQTQKGPKLTTFGNMVS